MTVVSFGRMALPPTTIGFRLGAALTLLRARGFSSSSLSETTWRLGCGLKLPLVLGFSSSSLSDTTWRLGVDLDTGLAGAARFTGRARISSSSEESALRFGGGEGCLRGGAALGAALGVALGATLGLGAGSGDESSSIGRDFCGRQGNLPHQRAPMQLPSQSACWLWTWMKRTCLSVPVPWAWIYLALGILVDSLCGTVVATHGGSASTASTSSSLASRR